MSQREREKERERKSKELLFSFLFLSKHVVRVALLFSPLAPCLAASTTDSLEWQLDSLLSLSFETLGLRWASALPDQPPPLDHLKNHLIWVDSIKMIPLACCRMSLEGLLGTLKFPTILLKLSSLLFSADVDFMNFQLAENAKKSSSVR